MKNILLLIVLFLFLASCSSQETDELAEEQKPAVTFVINVHDWYYIDESAESLTHILNIFDTYGVKAEFYFTEPVFKAYETHHPEVLQRILAEGMTISYHLRAPHPVTFVSGSLKDLDALSEQERFDELMNFETHELHLITGNYDETKEGGYAYIKKKIGYAPVVAGLNAKTDSLRKTELAVLKQLGLQMFVRKHTGDIIEKTSQGILTRPSQFSVEYVGDEFWWKANKTLYPAELFANAAGYGVVLVHDSDFFSPSAGWMQVYWRLNKQGKYVAKEPPYNLAATESSFVFYDPVVVEYMWQNYEAMVAYASEHFDVITSKDIIKEYNQGTVRT